MLQINREFILEEKLLNRQAWIKALRSKKYKQIEDDIAPTNSEGDYRWDTNDRCAIGVGFDVMAKMGKLSLIKNSMGRNYLGGNYQKMEEEFRALVGMDDDDLCKIIGLNDGTDPDTRKQVKFYKLAQIIEKMPVV